MRMLDSGGPPPSRLFFGEPKPNSRPVTGLIISTIPLSGVTDVYLTFDGRRITSDDGALQDPPSFYLDFLFRFLVAAGSSPAIASKKPPSSRASLVALLMCLNRSPPSRTPPNHRETTTSTFFTSRICATSQKALIERRQKKNKTQGPTCRLNFIK